MSGEIQSNLQDATAAAQMISNSLRGYCNFNLTVLSGYAPVVGSSTHDGMSGSIGQTFSSWQTLLESDAKAILDTGTAFDSADSAFALSLLGIGAGDA